LGEERIVENERINRGTGHSVVKDICLITGGKEKVKGGKRK